MGFTLKPIKPKGRDLRKMERAVREAMTEVAEEAVEMFEGFTETWQNKPVFTITETKDGALVTTDDPVFAYQDEGTPPHVITPKRARVLKFNASGTTLFRPRVQHPGTQPRGYTTKVQKYTQGILPVVLAQKIGGALGD